MKYTLLLLLLFAGFVFAQDHSKFVEGPFDSPQEVTDQCLICHDYASEEVMNSSHWVQSEDKKLTAYFSIGTSSARPMGSGNFAGYGWQDKDFDFSDESNVDCLVCHDQTGTYKVVNGYPGKDVDLLAIAQSVANPTRDNCGSCHFGDEGSFAVTHGDLDASLSEPSMDLDIHMGGLDFSCTECHTTDNHEIAGAAHGPMLQGDNHISCSDCHGEEIHELSIIDRHIEAVACETCHIPEIAREEPAVTYWDLSEAGKDKEETENEDGKLTYSKNRGELKWEKNLRPVYTWYNGDADYYAPGEKVEKTDDAVALNTPGGDISDREAKIYPFKLLKGKQPYDPKNNYIIIPRLYGEGGFLQTYNWEKAAEAGMKDAGLDFADTVAFIETEMFLPVNHMVPPSSEALRCQACHGDRGDRMDWEKLGYPGDPLKERGREKNKLLK